MDYKENESEVGLYLKTLVYQNIQRLANSDLRLKSKIINLCKLEPPKREFKQIG